MERMRKTCDERPSDFERTSLFADAIFAMPSTPKLPDGLLNPTFIFTQRYESAEHAEFAELYPNLNFTRGIGLSNRVNPGNIPAL